MKGLNLSRAIKCLTMYPVLMCRLDALFVSVRLQNVLHNAIVVNVCISTKVPADAGAVESLIPA